MYASITVPMDLDVKMKANMLAACFLIVSCRHIPYSVFVVWFSVPMHGEVSVLFVC